MPTFEELAPKQSGIDAKLARGIEEDHDWQWVKGPNGPEPSTIAGCNDIGPSALVLWVAA